jgi:hypothetical protein
VSLEEGEFIIVARGLEHKPVPGKEWWILIFEPASTLSTGPALASEFSGWTSMAACPRCGCSLSYAENVLKRSRYVASYRVRCGRGNTGLRVTAMSSLLSFVMFLVLCIAVFGTTPSASLHFFSCSLLSHIIVLGNSLCAFGQSNSQSFSGSNDIVLEPSA